MSKRTLIHLLWRSLGGVVGVTALLGLAVTIGWAHRHLVALIA